MNFLLELLLLHHMKFGKLYFHFHLSQGIFWFPQWILHWPIGFLVAYCLVSMCMFFSHFSSCNWFPLLYHFGQKGCFDIISIHLNLLRLVFWPTCLSWRTFHACLKRMFILLYWYGISYRYVLSPTGLMCHLRPLFPYWFSIWMICPLMYVVYWSPLLILLSISPFMSVNICF